ncbi:Sugar phosphate isomerase/epimerase [Caldanaerobius fijiensis DSM 17918]|uniref:Sugar phosphate isomerase/epimerase n=1 Tax=Caldanaerobius fijiensis DSM 17918 TaxID=1121256 RepID=A0A1M4ZCS6_9THEO|nr:sugar phosphate isomerase/epimerase family protein [Caldanaerobius fijiensis]SHF15859.1 Sugar phosphate isomerase/epimerase [Caldanaerobius fijiensis DSM 17918]
MKIGLSTYSLVQLIYKNEMTVLDAIQWIADNGGEHVEIVPFGFTLADNPQLVEDIRKKAEDVGLEISMYSILANLLQETEEDYEREIKRLMDAVDITHNLGAKFMRHDVVAFRNMPEDPVKQFEIDLPKIVEGCKRIADYAAQYGIITTIENHGFYVNGSERVQRVLNAVNKPNFKTTVDVGNFLCVDQDPLIGVKDNMRFAAMIHLKDFYVRKYYDNPGEGWFRTSHGNYLRGAIVGQGDMDIRHIIKIIKDSGYDGYISVEFEGLEDPRIGSKYGMDNAKRIWNEV